MTHPHARMLTHTHTHTQTHLYIHSHTHIYARAHTHTHIYTHTHTHTYTHHHHHHHQHHQQQQKQRVVFIGAFNSISNEERGRGTIKREVKTYIEKVRKLIIMTNRLNSRVGTSVLLGIRSKQ